MNGWILMDGVIDIWMEGRIDVFDDSVKLNSPTRLRDDMKLPNERTECQRLRPELELAFRVGLLLSEWKEDSSDSQSLNELTVAGRLPTLKVPVTAQLSSMVRTTGRTGRTTC